MEYTRGGTGDAGTLTTDPEEIDWCTLDRRAFVTSEGKRKHADIGKVTIPSSGTGTSMDINFRFHL